jgi:hypothetical protein
MTRQNISTGSTSNDGTGDTLRTAGTKINQNFVEIYHILGGDSDNLSSQISFDSDSLIFTGSSYQTALDFINPTANRTITIPDTSGTLVLNNATQTLYNKTLQLPSINDDSDNEIIVVQKNANSAVNYVAITNGETAVAPSVTAGGSDTNINLKLSPKGTGSVDIQKLSLQSELMDSDGAAATNRGYTRLNSASAMAVSVTNGSTPGEIKVFTNRGAGTATITPASFAQGTSFTLPQYSSAQIIWDEVNWYLISAFPDSDVTIT